MEKYILWFFTFLWFLALPFWLAKKGLRDWLLVYLIKLAITVPIDTYLVEHDYLEYPVRQLASIFDTSITFDMLIFPLACVFYNQTTYHSNLTGILGQSLVYSGILAALEFTFHRYTDLLTYHNWSILHTFITLNITFLVVRGLMALIRKYDSLPYGENRI